MRSIRVIKSFFKVSLSAIVNYLLKVFNPFVVYRIGNAIGDQLCMSAIVRLVDEQYSFRVITISSYPEIFNNNPRVWKNIGVKIFSLYISRLLRFLSGPQLENFLFKDQDKSLAEYMRSSEKNLHLVEAHSKHFHHRIKYNLIQNEIFLSQSEVDSYIKKFNLTKPYAVIGPNSKITYTPNKQWPFDNFQKVVDKTPNIDWIQVGEKKEPLLNNVKNFVGKTNLREFFYIISRAQFVLANEGLLNHVASAFGVKSYVIQSGFSDASLARYANTVFISSDKMCDKSPCWLLKECGIIGKPCLSGITPKDVAKQLL